MKTKILFIVSSFFLLSCGSQKKPEKQIIKYNFKAESFDISDIKPVHGRPTVLEISNINNLFYKVEINSKDVAVKDSNLFEKEEPPKEVKKPEDLPEEKNLSATSAIVAEISKTEISKKNNTIDQEDFKKVTSNISSEILDNLKLLDQKKKIKDPLDKAISSIDNELLKLKTEKNNLFNKKNKDSIDFKNYTAILESMKEKELEKAEMKRDLHIVQKEIENYIAKNDQLNVRFTKLNNDNNDIKNLIEAYFEAIKEDYTKFYQIAVSIYKINENYNNYIDTVYRPELTKIEYESIKNQKGLENCIILNKEKINEFYGKTNQFDDIKSKLMMNLNDITLYKIKKQVEALPHGAKMIEDLNKDITQIKKDVEVISKTVNDLNIRKKLNYVETLDRILSDDDTYKYSSVPIQGFEDYLKFDITVISKTKSDENKYIIDRSKTFEYKEYIKGGVRFDFSIGTVFDLGNKQQEFEVIQDITVYKIIQKTNNQYIPTIAGMLHSSWRSANNFAFGFSLGVSMDMTKLQLNSLFPGISLLVGKTDKIIFTAGPALRKITELQNGFALDQSLNYSPQNYTAESYKLGWFVGVSWNLTTKQKSLMRLSY